MGDSRLTAAAAVLVAVGVVVAAVVLPTGDGPAPASSPSHPGPTPVPSPTSSAVPSPSPSPTPTTGLGEPWGEVDGLLQFRGNPSHTWYGAGPAPEDPVVAWRYPDRALCSEEVVDVVHVPVATSPRPAPSGTGTAAPAPQPRTSPSPVVKLWCGTGWTGQPAVWAHQDGTVEVVVGAFDGAVHFVDLDTGQATRPPFRTGEMIKGSVTLDPDGFPLLYTGSRDNRFRIVALDRDEPVELWGMDAHPQRVWNSDWDGNASIVDGRLLVGGEDSWFYVVELNRTTDADGMVQVRPEVVVTQPGFSDELFGLVGDSNVSIESSPVVDVDRDRVYVANSGGRVLGLDLAAEPVDGALPVVFDYWLGDDTDASLVLDDDGMLYAAVELERKLPRADEVGQLVKLDPFAPDEPRVWGVAVPPRPPPGVASDDGGLWGTPALYRGHLYALTHPGDLLVVDAASGEVTHREDVGYHEWSSPVVVEDPDSGAATLVVALCEEGAVRGYDLADPATPAQAWQTDLPGGACIESTPAVWRSRMVVGSRDGFLYGFAAS